MVKVIRRVDIQVVEVSVNSSTRAEAEVSHQELLFSTVAGTN